jgi:cytochrome c5
MSDLRHTDEAHDRHFFDTFMLVLGALVGLTVVIYFTAGAIAESNLDIENKEEAAAQAALEKRIEPVGRVAVAGQPAAAQAAPAAPTMVAAAQPAKPVAAAAPAKVDGAKVYQSACFACHGTGAAGAPKLGDKAAWAPRVKLGMDTLKKHALQGFTGKTGIMPPKGGFTHLSDAEVLAALDYMLGQSK